MEADIRPFRGLLLGLFFVTTGTSIDLVMLQQEWPTVLALTAGLITIKVSRLRKGGRWVLPVGTYVPFFVFRS